MRERRSSGEFQLERRAVARLPLHVDVTCSVAGACFDGTTTDLTVQGLFLETDHDVPRDSTVDLSLDLPGQNEPAKATGRVMRAARRVGEARGLAIEFTSLDRAAKTRIQELVAAALEEFARKTN